MLLYLKLDELSLAESFLDGAYSLIYYSYYYL